MRRSTLRGRSSEANGFIFDAALDSIGAVSTWIIEPVITSSAGFDNATVGLISQILVVRILRLLRRVLRTPAA